MHWLLHPHWAVSMDFRISTKLVLTQKHMHTLTGWIKRNASELNHFKEKRNEEWASVKSWKRLKWIMLVHQRRLNRSYVDSDEAATQTVCCLSVSVWKAGRPWRGATNRERSEGVRNIWLNRSEDATQLSLHLFYAVCAWAATALSFDAREHYQTMTSSLHHLKILHNMCLLRLFSPDQTFSTIYSVLSLMEVFTLAGTGNFLCCLCPGKLPVCPNQSSFTFHLGLLLSHWAEQALI